MNRELATWHTARALLFVAAFCCLLQSVFVELPGRSPGAEVPGKEFRGPEIARRS